MIKEGDKAPAMTVTASDGSTVGLSAPGQKLVLYFYPKDDAVDVALVDPTQWLTSCDDDALAAGVNLA